MRGPEQPKQSWGKKQQYSISHTSDFKTHHKATVINQKAIGTSIQTDIEERSEVNLHIYGQLISNKGTFYKERTVIPINSAGGTGIFTCKSPDSEFTQ